MSEKIIQGSESQEEATKRHKAWKERDTDLAHTPMQLEDMERLLRGLATPGEIAAAKRARGQAMP